MWTIEAVEVKRKPSACMRQKECLCALCPLPFITDKPAEIN